MTLKWLHPRLKEQTTPATHLGQRRADPREEPLLACGASIFFYILLFQYIDHMWGDAISVHIRYEVSLWIFAGISLFAHEYLLYISYQYRHAHSAIRGICTLESLRVVTQFINFVIAGINMR